MDCTLETNISTNSKSLLARSVLVLLLVVTACCVQASEVYPARCRTTSNLIVREGPGKGFSRIGMLAKGEYFTAEYIAESQPPAAGAARWAAVDYRGKQGYVSMQYVFYVDPIEQADEADTNDFCDSWVADILLALLELAKGLARLALLFVIILLLIAYWHAIIVNALRAALFALAGAVVFLFFGCSGRIGAWIGLGVAVLVGLCRLAYNGFSFSMMMDELNAFFTNNAIFWMVFYYGYYVLSLPLYFLNQIEHVLVEPWRYLFRTNWVSESAKPVVRIVLEGLSVIMYILTTPLRFFNAFVYNILVHCATVYYDLMVEVLIPSDDSEGGRSVGRWLLMLPWRLLKYPIFHGTLAVLESVIWTVVDIFIPARTLYHGTSFEACEAIIRDPYRNSYLKSISDWTSGNFLSSTLPQCSWAGRGVYFAIDRKLAFSYSHRSQAPVMMACRVSMGRVLCYTLAPNRVYSQAGNGGDHDEFNKYGDAHGYTTGQWYNHRHHWEYCLFDWKNLYNHPWRIRPVYVLNLRTGRVQHIRGGMRHWLFDRSVLKSLTPKFRRPTAKK